MLQQQSITDVILLVGYLGYQIEDYFADGHRFGLTVRYSHEESPLGTGGALREALHLLDQRFLLIYGDSYSPTDYSAPMQRLQASAAKGVIVLYDNRVEDTSVRNNIAVDSAGYVTRYEKDRNFRSGPAICGRRSARPRPIAPGINAVGWNRVPRRKNLPEAHRAAPISRPYRDPAFLRHRQPGAVADV